jgi:hypothetical protein
VWRDPISRKCPYCLVEERSEGFTPAMHAEGTDDDDLGMVERLYRVAVAGDGPGDLAR